ncbi:MAG: GxxExxY protein [Candidatus Marinimicrobia bacterium]|jgi:GxxExxY protein|nr:GxxExxY protein [Candidatus Neomarinimicrobiota bacterium]MBT5364009.1 GxxExxY protein [Candidatus Neomarinimicrobiota bacterium]MBT5461684.1 GxxExxY protein [Candidatus Neomarinimicrobiota bacterium]MBT5720933.1 GxxExxY protein [Candidatus Neomarinimicrobiota bacterium]
MKNIDINKLTEQIIGASIEVHKILGPGLLESAYQEALVYELRLRGFFVEEEVLLPVVYKTITLKKGFRADVIVEKSVMLELKAQEDRHDVFQAQTLNNTRLAKCKIGLLINFHHKKLVNGLKRFIF